MMFSVAEFFDLLPVADIEGMRPPVQPQGSSRLADGRAIPFSLGAPMWRAEISLRAQRVDCGAQVMTRLSQLQRVGASCLITNWPVAAPAADPKGVILGAAMPVIHTISAGGTRMRISGLPAAYALRIGDWVGVSYGADPLRYQVVVCAEDVTASGAGLTPEFDITPGLRHGVPEGAGVTLVKPAWRARVVSVSGMARRRGWFEGGVIRLEEVIR